MVYVVKLNMKEDQNLHFNNILHIYFEDALLIRSSRNSSTILKSDTQNRQYFASETVIFCLRSGDMFILISILAIIVQFLS